MKFDVVTIFPRMVLAGLAEGVVSRGIVRGLIDLAVHDLRDYTADRHRSVDDVPYGGGGGMVLMPGPLFGTVEAIRELHPASSSRTILLCPQGTRYDQAQARRLSEFGRLILICGHYEGVDERVREHLIGLISALSVTRCD